MDPRYSARLPGANQAGALDQSQSTSGRGDLFGSPQPSSRRDGGSPLSVRCLLLGADVRGMRLSSLILCCPPTIVSTRGLHHVLVPTNHHLPPPTGHIFYVSQLALLCWVGCLSPWPAHSRPVEAHPLHCGPLSESGTRTGTCPCAGDAASGAYPRRLPAHRIDAVLQRRTARSRPI